MSVFAAIFKNDLKLFAKDWKAVLLITFMPFAVVFIITNTLGSALDDGFADPFKIALVDKEDTVRTRLLKSQLDSIDIFEEVITASHEDCTEMLKKDLVAAVIIIPEGFTNSIQAGENLPIQLTGNPNMPFNAQIVKDLMVSISNIVSAGQSSVNTTWHFGHSAGLSDSEMQELYKKTVLETVDLAVIRRNIFLDSESIKTQYVTPYEHYTAAMIPVFLMFAGFPAIKMLIYERRKGLLKRIYSSPVSPFLIVFSKFIIAALTGILQFTVIAVLTSKIMGNYWGVPVWDVVFLFMAVLFTACCWSTLTGAVSPSYSSAHLIGSLGILIMAVAGGNIYPLVRMPEIFKSISLITPNRWAMEGFKALFSGNWNGDILYYCLPLMFIGFVMLAISAAVLTMEKRYST